MNGIQNVPEINGVQHSWANLSVVIAGRVVTGITKISYKDSQTMENVYGEVYSVEVDGSACYLHKPDRSTLKAVASVGMNDPIRSNEVLLENCWLGGDECMKTDDSKFMSVSPVLAELIQIKEATLKKL